MNLWKSLLSQTPRRECWPITFILSMFLYLTMDFLLFMSPSSRWHLFRNRFCHRPVSKIVVRSLLQLCSPKKHTPLRIEFAATRSFSTVSTQKSKKKALKTCSFKIQKQIHHRNTYRRPFVSHNGSGSGSDIFLETTISQFLSQEFVAISRLLRRPLGFSFFPL